jgi:NAD(P)H-hydrate repair Nnr-like enzyme with NAD(P)H-hydrate dehydratase domain
VGFVQKNRCKSTVAFAEKYKVHVVLKGARSVIAHPDGRVFINPTGNPSMASGGMGDVLTGMIAGFITQGYSIEKAVHLGVYLHGAIGDLLYMRKGPVGILASDIIDLLPEIIGDMAEGKLEPLNNIGHCF